MRKTEKSTTTATATIEKVAPKTIPADKKAKQEKATADIVSVGKTVPKPIVPPVDESVRSSLKSESGATLPYRVNVMTFDDFLDMNPFIPEFQRSSTAWDVKKQAKYVECLVGKRIVPPLIIANVEGKPLLIDGLQRKTAIESQLQIVERGIEEQSAIRDALLGSDGKNITKLASVEKTLDTLQALQDSIFSAPFAVLEKDCSYEVAAQMFIDLNAAAILSVAQRKKPNLRAEVMEALNFVTNAINQKDWSGKKADNTANMLTACFLNADDASTSTNSAFKVLEKFPADQTIDMANLEVDIDRLVSVMDSATSTVLEFFAAPARMIPLFYLIMTHPEATTDDILGFLGDFDANKRTAKSYTIRIPRRGKSVSEKWNAFSAFKAEGARSNSKKYTAARRLVLSRSFDDWKKQITTEEPTATTTTEETQNKNDIDTVRNLLENAMS